MWVYVLLNKQMTKEQKVELISCSSSYGSKIMRVHVFYCEMCWTWAPVAPLSIATQLKNIKTAMVMYDFGTKLGSAVPRVELFFLTIT